MAEQNMVIDPSAKYLGDGVYCYTDGFHLVLVTTNGIRVTNHIYLDPDVVDGLKNEIIDFQNQMNS